MSTPTRTHFTAWMVNDTSCLETGCMDITVLEDQFDGADPGKDSDWITDASKPPAFHAVTTVDAREGDAQDGCDQADALMREAGWERAGGWDVVDNAYIATVRRVDGEG